jgi:hypothetical protein
MPQKPMIAAAVIPLLFLLSGSPADCVQTQASAGIVAFKYGQPKELSKLKDERINESSGLAASIRNKDAFWTHNDSGDSNRIFLINKNGETIAIVHIKGASAVDWEDIASFRLGEESYVLIADTGDNARMRKNCVLYVIREPVISTKSEDNQVLSIETEPVWTINFTYEDGPHDCESVAVDPIQSTVYLVSKASGECKVYSMLIPSKGADKPSVAKAVAALKLPYVTAMDISPDGSHAVLLTYGDAYEFVRSGSQTWAEAFTREPSVVKAPPRKQGESVCYGTDGKTLYLTSEDVSQPLWEIPFIDGTE